MNEQQMQQAVDDLCKRMVDNGMEQPRAEVSFKSYSNPYVYMTWWDSGTGKYEICNSNTVSDAIESANKFLDTVASKQERDMADFRARLAEVIDLGRANGIDVDFINPLQETMKRLSENAITHQV